MKAVFSGRSADPGPAGGGRHREKVVTLMRVLLIVEQKPLARNLRQRLAGGGFAADVAAAGAEATARLRAATYDVVVLDLVRSGEDGLALLQGWRRAGLAAHVLVLTAAKSLAEVVRGLDLGADDALTRPFQVEELLARLRALARRRHRRAPAVLRIHDLEIDTVARTVKRGGRTIRLTPREYALLELLITHRGRVVTRPMVREHVYDDSDAATSNVVDVYIRYLRNKIDKGFDPPLILTRWGQGYLLRPDDA
jgi:DNA-binding response OmpR family regulator